MAYIRAMMDLERVGLERFQASAGDASRLLKALSNEHRLMILCQIGKGERQVSDLQTGRPHRWAVPRSGGRSGRLEEGGPAGRGRPQTAAGADASGADGGGRTDPAGRRAGRHGPSRLLGRQRLCRGGPVHGGGDGLLRRFRLNRKWFKPRPLRSGGRAGRPARLAPRATGRPAWPDFPPCAAASWPQSDRSPWASGGPILDGEILSPSAAGVTSDGSVERLVAIARRGPVVDRGHLRPGAEPAPGDGGGRAAARPDRGDDGHGFDHGQPADDPAGGDDRRRSPVDPALAAPSWRADGHSARRRSHRSGLSGPLAVQQRRRPDPQRRGGRRRRGPHSGPGARRHQARLSDAVRHGHGRLYDRHHGRRGRGGGDGGGLRRGVRLGRGVGALVGSGPCGGRRLDPRLAHPCRRRAEPPRPPRLGAGPYSGAGHLGLHARAGVVAALLCRHGAGEGDGGLPAQRHDGRRGAGGRAGIASGGPGHAAAGSGDRRRLSPDPDPGDGPDRRSGPLRRPARLRSGRRLHHRQPVAAGGRAAARPPVGSQSGVDADGAGSSGHGRNHPDLPPRRRQAALGRRVAPGFQRLDGAEALQALLGAAALLGMDALAVFIDLGRLQRRQQAVVDIHRLELRAFHVPAGDVFDQGAHRRFRRRRGQIAAQRLGGGQSSGEQAHRRALDIALDPRHLTGEAQARQGLQPHLLVQQLGAVQEGVAVQTAQTRELGVLKPGNHAENLCLYAIFQLGLETDHIIKRAECIILTQLHDGVGLDRRVVLVRQADRLHRTVAQGLAAALGHDLDRQAAVEIGHVLPFLEVSLGAVQQGVDEGLVLGLVHRTVHVSRLVAAGAFLVIARLAPGHVEVDAVGVNDRRDGVEEAEGLFARRLQDRLSQGGRGLPSGPAGAARHPGLGGRLCRLLRGVLRCSGWEPHQHHQPGRTGRAEPVAVDERPVHAGSGLRRHDGAGLASVSVVQRRARYGGRALGHPPAGQAFRLSACVLAGSPGCAGRSGACGGRHLAGRAPQPGRADDLRRGEDRHQGKLGHDQGPFLASVGHGDPGWSHVYSGGASGLHHHRPAEYDLRRPEQSDRRRDDQCRCAGRPVLAGPADLGRGQRPAVGGAGGHNLRPVLRLAVVTLALADVAGDVDVGQEVHLDLDDAVALTGLAAAALDVEAEAAGTIAARLGLGEARIPVADRPEGAGVGGRVRARGAADRRLVDVDDLVEMLQPLDAIEGSGGVGRIVQAPRGRLVERLDGEGRLAAARDAGNAGEDADRDLARDVLQVVAGGARNLEHPLAVDRTATFGRQLDLARAGQILTGQGVGVGHDLSGRALGADRWPPHRARPPAPSCRDHAAPSGCPAGGCCPAGAGQWTVRPEHRGRRSGPIRSATPGGCAGSRRPTGCRMSATDSDSPARHCSESAAGLRDRQVGDVGDVLAADLDRQSLRLQALAAADLARRFGLIAAQFLAHPGAVGLAPAPLKVRQHALERFRDLVFAGVVVIDELDLVAARAAQDDGLRLLRQIAPRLVHREAVVQGQRLQRLRIERRGTPRPRRHRAFVQGLVAVRDHQVGVEGQLDPQAVTGRAGAEGVVEREQPRLDLADGETRDRAGELLGKNDPTRLFAFGRIRPFRRGDAVGQTQGCLDAVGVAALKTFFGYNAVHDDIDVVLELLVERGRVLDGIEFAIDLQPLEALTLPLGHFLLVLALAAANDRRQQQDALAVGQGGQLVDHLADGLALDRQAGGGRIGNAYARPEQTHIVVDFGDGADGRARVLRRRLLFDRDGRGQALDQVHVRLAHQLQELARIGRQALDIATLALGIDGVERQRGFARPRQAGHDHQLLARNVEIDALEVMLAGAANANEVMLFGHGIRERGRPRNGPRRRRYMGINSPKTARTI
uniref:LigA n=1 Tax=Parastrongyloides trichosuri TaxID=131310 RepID=A0A0N4Z8C9_PARTI